MNVHNGHLIRILHWCTDQTMSAALEEMDLTAAQGRIMGFVAHQQEPPCPRDIETEFHLSHPTVSGLLSRLEQKGFIQLRSDPLDRRCKRIYIQARGLECHQAMHQTILSIESRLVQDFTEEEKQQFSIFLQKAISNMGIAPCQPNPKEEPKQ